MTSDSTVVPLRQPDTVDDPLTAVLREGARRLLAQAVKRRPRRFSPRYETPGWRTVGNAWCDMAMAPSG